MGHVPLLYSTIILNKIIDNRIHDLKQFMNPIKISS
jgi:hypothetical protein